MKDAKPIWSRLNYPVQIQMVLGLLQPRSICQSTERCQRCEWLPSTLDWAIHHPREPRTAQQTHCQPKQNSSPVTEWPLLCKSQLLQLGESHLQTDRFTSRHPTVLKRGWQRVAVCGLWWTTFWTFCQHVIKNTYRCKLCPDSSDSFNSKEDFRKHHASLHLDLEEEEFLEFDWIILRPGNGHFDMNMCKTFVKLGCFFLWAVQSHGISIRERPTCRQEVSRPP